MTNLITEAFLNENSLSICYFFKKINGRPHLLLEFLISAAFMQHPTNSEQELRCSEHQRVLKTDKTSMEAYGTASSKSFIAKKALEILPQILGSFPSLASAV